MADDGTEKKEITTEESKARRRLLIVGAGQTGRALARILSDMWEIAVVDPDAAKLERMREEVGGRSIKTFAKDGTSLLNLKEAGLESSEWLVATTDRDEANAEACRVALSVPEPPSTIGILRRPEHREKLRGTGAEVIVRPEAVAGLVKNRVERAHQVATGVGLGQGEIIEIPVLHSSPAVNARVQDLRARRWLVAAIYRDGRFVVPHGYVVIRDGDRLLLTGEPEILPHIADYLRAGVARFPLQYGVRTVALARGSEPESFWGELRYVAERTRSRAVRAITPKSSPAPDLVIGRAKMETQLMNATDDPLTVIRRDLPGLDCGCLVLPKERVGFLRRAGIGRPKFSEYLELLACPLLLSGGSHPYRRIVLPVLEPDATMLAAELAIDVARQLEVNIKAVAVSPPPFIVGEEGVAEQKEALKTVLELGSLYHMKIESMVIEGNPAKEIARIAGQGDLVVVAVSATRGTSFFRPDTAVQLIARCESSVLALSYRERIHGTV